MTNDSIKFTNLLTVSEIAVTLKKLSYRHQILEACLIVEEYIDVFIELYLPNLLTTKIKLSFEQKLCFFEYFLNDADKDFSKFPRMLQSFRNKVAHNRKHVIDKNSLSEFYKKLGSKEKKFLEIKAKEFFKIIRKSPVSFSSINPNDQFIFLMIWFTGGLKVEIDRGSFQFFRIEK